MLAYVPYKEDHSAPPSQADDEADGRRLATLILRHCKRAASSSERDVDLKRAELHVRQHADRYGVIGKPKSRAGQRTVPLPPIVVSTLREWKLACPRGELGLVFPTSLGTVESHANIIARAFEPAQIAAGVVDKDGRAKYGLHALRHFYASWCINRKVDGGLELPPNIKLSRHDLAGRAVVPATVIADFEEGAGTPREPHLVVRIFGEDGDCQITSSPACRDTGPPSWRVSCF